MKEWEKQIILDAYKRCFGLEESFKKFTCSPNPAIKNQTIKTLSAQTGLRTKFIEDNLKEIQEL